MSALNAAHTEILYFNMLLNIWVGQTFKDASRPFIGQRSLHFTCCIFSVSLSDEGFCVGVCDIVLECCCPDVSVMQSVFPVRERESKERVGDERGSERHPLLIYSLGSQIPSLSMPSSTH